jgi:hypothetical protein
VDGKVLARINTFMVMGPGDPGDRGIIMGSTRQDSGKMEIETPDRREAIISTIGIPFPVSMRIHRYEAAITTLNTEKKRDSVEGRSAVSYNFLSAPSPYNKQCTTLFPWFVLSVPKSRAGCMHAAFRCF